MEKYCNPQTALGLAGVDLVLIIGSTAYLNSKIDTLNCKVEKIENDSKCSGDFNTKKVNKYDPNIPASIDDIYDRLESLESEIEIYKQRLMRSEYLINKILSKLSSEGMTVNIDKQSRRIKTPRKSKDKKEINVRKATSVSSLCENDDDVLDAIASAKSTISQN